MAEEPKQTKARPWRPLLLLVAVAAAFVLAKVLGLDERLGDLRGWMEDLGPLGPVAFIALYGLATVAALPGSALTVVAGALFGSVVGVAVVSAGSTLGAAAAFLISRYFARDAVASWLGRSTKFRSLDLLTERQGALMVALARLVPFFPYNLLNYGFGLTRVRFVTYVFWSWLCMLPATVLYVVGGDTIVAALKAGRVPWLLVGVLAIAAALLAVLGVMARRKLRTCREDLEVEKGPDHGPSHSCPSRR